MVRNVINNYILGHSANVLSLVATAQHNLRTFCHCPRCQCRHEPTIEHKYSLLELRAKTWPEPLLITESMQDHKQHICNNLIINITWYSLSIGSRQTQHIELQIDDLDHVRQLTRSDNDSTMGRRQPSSYCYGPIVQG